MFVAEGSVREKILKAANLSNEESRNDPESDPYKSKYLAREILQELKNDIDKNSSDNDDRWGFLIAGLDLRLGVNFIETEELSTGEERLAKCVEALEKHRLNGLASTTLQNALNQLGILWASRRRPTQALSYLEKAQSLYKDFKHEVGNSPSMPDEMCAPVNEEDSTIMKKREEAFESTYTHTLYYLAQVYEKLDESEKAAQHCHVTLYRQLESMKYEPVDWALNAATLSQYYINVENFTMARHCLASASTIIKEVPETEVETEFDPDSQAGIDVKEKLPRAKIDIQRCWIKYAISLLEASRDKLFREVESQPEHNPSTPEEKQDLENVDELGEKKSNLFFNLEVTASEDKITDKYVNVFEEGREIFLMGQKWVNTAKEFYVLDGHCTDHVEIVQDHSKLFKFLSFFEMDFERQCKMHKRRADMLEDLLGNLSMQFYLLVCRQLMYEIAEIYSAMLDLKLSIMEDREVAPTPHAVKKINLLAEQSIAKYQAYLDSLRNAQKEMPSKLCDDDERPALVAYFCMGRLHSKFISAEPGKRIEYLKRSHGSYKALVDYCHRNPTCIPKVKSELDICEEMVTLLPAKMDRIRANAGF